MKTQKPIAIVLATGDYLGMTYADIATSPETVARHYSCGSAKRVYFYNAGFVRAAIASAEGGQ